MILCSGSDDRTIRCWNILTMNCEAIISDYASPIYDLDFSSAQSLLVSSDEEGAIRLQSTKNLQNFVKLMIFINALENVFSF